MGRAKSGIKNHQAMTNPEIPGFPMKRIVGGFASNTRWAEEELSKIAIGAEVEIKVKRRRSLPQLQLYWVVLDYCVENSEKKYGRAEDLHGALKVALGYQRIVEGLDGKTLVFPGSVSFIGMSQADFNVYFERAMNELRNAGYPVDSYIQEGKQKLARMRVFTKKVAA